MMSKVADSSARSPSVMFPEEEDEMKSGKGRRRKPKRVLHFSDGTLEEYSSDEEVQRASLPPLNSQLLKTDQIAHLKWFPWFWYQTSSFGSKALAACDYLGESLANFFGILSPKYEYEIEQFKRAAFEEEERRREDAELGSLSSAEAAASGEPLTSQPRY